MTLNELALFNGQKGQPAYVAISGIIYDVSSSPLWKEGNHEGAHQAGCDLTQALKAAPHIAAVIERFPSVERLEETREQEVKSGLKLAVSATIVIVLLLAWFLLH